MAYSPTSGSFSYRRRPGSAGTLSSTRKDLALTVQGLSELRRGLKKIAPEAEKEFGARLRKMASSIRDEARRFPKGTPKNRSYALQKSIKHSVKKTEIALYSDSPYARAHEWGTSGQGDTQVQPQGVPIKIKRSQMLGHAVYSNRMRVRVELREAIDDVARRNAFNGRDFGTAFGR